MQELSLHGGFVKVDHFGLECSTVHEPGDENKVETTPHQFSHVGLVTPSRYFQFSNSLCLRVNTAAADDAETQAHK